MDQKPIVAKYKGGGTSSYHPKMMMKVLVFAYTQQIYSSRRIAKALRESIPFMWLSGLNQPDFRTINRFRGVQLKGIIEEVFYAVLKLLIEEGYLKLEDLFVDGTKIEANANRYTAVWAKNSERYEQQLAKKVAELLAEIEQINQAEDQRYGDQDLEEVGGEGWIDGQKLSESVEKLNQQLQIPEETTPVADETVARPVSKAAAPEQKDLPLVSQIEQHLEKIEQAVATQPENKRLRKAVRTLRVDYLVRARRYAEQRRKLAGRNSYSKTDVDATFMRMKEDQDNPTSHPKPAYNIQNGTEGQFVVSFSVHQEAGDCNCFIPHIAQLKAGIGHLPEKINADAAYGNEENYAYVEKERVDNYLKYVGFDRQQKPRYRPNPFQAENMPYDPQTDSFTCPADKRLTFQSIENRTTKNGYLTRRRVYECAECEGCHLKDKCTRAVGNRQINVSFPLREYREQAQQNLVSEEGLRLRKQRGVDVETVFGRIKENWGFRRFMLRGLEKVTVEWGLLCLAHNLAKVSSIENQPKLAGV
jgi:transposase